MQTSGAPSSRATVAAMVCLPLSAGPISSRWGKRCPVSRLACTARASVAAKPGASDMWFSVGACSSSSEGNWTGPDR